MSPPVKIKIEAEGPEQAASQIEQVTQALAKLGYSADFVQQALQQGAAAGEDMRATLESVGVSAEDADAALGRMAETTQRTSQVGTELRNMLGLGRGSLLSLITMLGVGSSAIFAIRRAMEAFIEKLTEGNRKIEEFRQSLILLASSSEEYKYILEEVKPALEGFDQTLAGIDPTMRALRESQVEAAREVDYLKGRYDLLGETLQGLAASEVKQTLKEQTLAIIEEGGSVEELTQKIYELWGVTEEWLAAQDPGTEATIKAAIAILQEAAAADEAAEKTKKLFEAFQALMGVAQAVSGLMSEMAQKSFQLGQAQERVGHQMTQAWENFSFRSQQAVESFTFNVEQAMEASQMRIWSMTERFHIQMWAAGARHGAAMAAMAARHALTIEGINQDHLDRLSDMEWDHERNKLRMLQRAPWWLQRELQDYQHEKARLEEAGDDEGLRQLKEALRDRLAAIDPVFAEQLDLLEEEFEHERDVEDREWGQRLSRTERMYAIQRNQAAQNFAISQAQAAAQFAIQMAMEEFQNRQRQERLEFQERQRQEALKQSYDQQVEDLAFGLGQQKETFSRWVTYEMIPEQKRQWKRIAKAGITAFKEEIDEGGDFLVRVKISPVPGGIIPPW